MIIHNHSHAILKGITVLPFITTIDPPRSFALSSIFTNFSQGKEHIPLKLLLDKHKLDPSNIGSAMHPWHYLNLESTNRASRFTYSDIHIILLSMYMYIYIYAGASLATVYLIHSYWFNIIQFWWDFIVTYTTNLINKIIIMFPSL